MSEENQRLTEVKTAMLLHVPFFASLLLDQMEVIVTKDSSLWDNMGLPPSCATDGKRIIWFEAFLSSLDLKEAVFVTCHEIAHMMWLHMHRAKVFQDVGFEGNEFAPDLWNVAGDYIINDMLVKSGIGTMPKCGLHDPGKYTGEQMVDDVYRDLYKKQPPQKGGGSGKSGQGQQQPGGGKPQQGNQPGNQQRSFDAHIPQISQTSEQDMKRAIATAKEVAKSMGKMPAALERMVDDYLKPQVSWKERLRHQVTRAVSREATTWSTPHRRRLVSTGIYYPSYTGFGAGVCVVIFDTSGSIGQTELNMFLTELNDILQTTRPEKIILMSCDAKVYEDAIHYLDAGEDIMQHPPKIKGGGGTSFIPPFKWIEDEGINPAAVVYLTDLYGSFPADAPHYPVIWCSTVESQVAPWGETIFIDRRQQ